MDDLNWRWATEKDSYLKDVICDGDNAYDFSALSPHQNDTFLQSFGNPFSDNQYVEKNSADSFQTAEMTHTTAFDIQTLLYQASMRIANANNAESLEKNVFGDHETVSRNQTQVYANNNQPMDSINVNEIQSPPSVIPSDVSDYGSLESSALESCNLPCRNVSSVVEISCNENSNNFAETNANEYRYAYTDKTPTPKLPYEQMNEDVCLIEDVVSSELCYDFASEPDILHGICETVLSTDNEQCSSSFPQPLHLNNLHPSFNINNLNPRSFYSESTSEVNLSDIFEENVNDLKFPKQSTFTGQDFMPNNSFPTSTLVNTASVKCVNPKKYCFEEYSKTWKNKIKVPDMHNSLLLYSLNDERKRQVLSNTKVVKRIAKRIKAENCSNKVTKSELHDMTKQLHPNDLRSSFIYSENADHRAQVDKWLNVLDLNDDNPICFLCLELFWYQTTLLQHLEAVHQITNPKEYIAKEKHKRFISKETKHQSSRVHTNPKYMALQGADQGDISRRIENYPITHHQHNSQMPEHCRRPFNEHSFDSSNLQIEKDPLAIDSNNCSPVVIKIKKKQNAQQKEINNSIKTDSANHPNFKRKLNTEDTFATPVTIGTDNSKIKSLNSKAESSKNKSESQDVTNKDDSNDKFDNLFEMKQKNKIFLPFPDDPEIKNNSLNTPVISYDKSDPKGNKTPPIRKRGRPKLETDSKTKNVNELILDKTASQFKLNPENCFHIKDPISREFRCNLCKYESFSKSQMVDHVKEKCVFRPLNRNSATETQTNINELQQSCRIILQRVDEMKIPMLNEIKTEIVEHELDDTSVNFNESCLLEQTINGRFELQNKCSNKSHETKDEIITLPHSNVAKHGLTSTNSFSNQKEISPIHINTEKESAILNHVKCEQERRTEINTNEKSISCATSLKGNLNMLDSIKENIEIITTDIQGLNDKIDSETNWFDSLQFKQTLNSVNSSIENVVKIEEDATDTLLDIEEERRESAHSSINEYNSELDSSIEVLEQNTCDKESSIRSAHDNVTTVTSLIHNMKSEHENRFIIPNESSYIPREMMPNLVEENPDNTIPETSSHVFIKNNIIFNVCSIFENSEISNEKEVNRST